MKRLTTILLFIFALVGCTPEESENKLLEYGEISLIWKDQAQVIFNEDTGQIGYNDQRHEYRVYDDKLADWFVVRCSEEPTEEGQTLSADVSWTGANSPKTFKGLSFSVKKTSPEGLIWLWNESEKIGIILKNIK